MSHGFNDDKTKFVLRNENINISDIILYAIPREFSNGSKAYVNSNVLSFYIKVTDYPIYNNTGVLFTFRDGYEPAQNYCVASIRSLTAPYKEIGTLWIDSNGKATYYLTNTTEKSFYIQGMFLLKGAA